jgi:putative tryptophan/tyrosine transport system substrate-binding protein
MGRREFIALAGWAAFWPLVARAQPQALPTVGFLSGRSPDESAPLVDAFRRGLAETGAVEGRNVAVQYRWALGEYDRLPVLAAELVRRPVTALVSVGGESSAIAAKAATATIPIAKRLGLLHEIVPKAATLGFLLNPSYPGTASQLRDMQEAAHTIGLQLHVERRVSQRFKHPQRESLSVTGRRV